MFHTQLLSEIAAVYLSSLRYEQQVSPPFFAVAFSAVVCYLYW